MVLTVKALSLVLFTSSRPGLRNLRPRSLHSSLDIHLSLFPRPFLANNNKNVKIRRHPRHPFVCCSQQATSESLPKTTMPDYNELAYADIVFDDAYFYGDDEETRKLFMEQRDKVLGDMTVKQAYIKFLEDHNGSIQEGVEALAHAIGAGAARIGEYYKNAAIPAEDILHGLEWITLTSSTKFLGTLKSKEITIQSLPTSQEVLDATLKPTKPDEHDNPDVTSRELNLAMVLGPRGSGKTFFALGELAPSFLRNREKHDKVVALHLNANETNVPYFVNNQENSKAAEGLRDYIQEALSRSTKREIKKDQKLQMHLCIILDNAGDASVRLWFENKNMLTCLCRHASELAESVCVVVAGAGLSGSQLNWKKDAYVFRMKPWKPNDLAIILAAGNFLKSLDDEKQTANAVAHDIFANPKIGVLVSNPRMAELLCYDLKYLGNWDRPKPLVWKSILDEQTTYLVTSIVESFIFFNGFEDLEPKGQRRVAASIIQALDERKPRDVTLPKKFVALNEREMEVANSLVQSNVEFGKRATLVAEEDFAITVTPAIETALYAMAGIPTALLPAEKEQAVLCGVRQAILANMETYVNKISRIPRRWRKKKKARRALEKLDQSLENIYVLKTTINAEPDASGKILIPMVAANTVLVNDMVEPFADTIAPYLLVCQATEPNKPVDLRRKLEECKLLKTCNDDVRFLQGLAELWKGNFPLDEYDTRNNLAKFQGKFKEILDTRGAYPPDFLYRVTLARRDPCPCAIIEGNNITTGTVTLPLPPILDATPMTFLLSTNGKEIQLQLSPNKMITITEKNLDKDLSIDVETFLNVSDQTAWTDFLIDEIREGVEIKFLLT